MDLNLNATDRRGLGEILAFSVITLTVGLVVVAQIIMGRTPDTAMMAILGAAATVVLARGSQGASERSGSSEALNMATVQMKQVLAQVVGEIVTQHAARLVVPVVPQLAQPEPPAPTAPTVANGVISSAPLPTPNQEPPK